MHRAGLLGSIPKHPRFGALKVLWRLVPGRAVAAEWGGAMGGLLATAQRTCCPIRVFMAVSSAPVFPFLLTTKFQDELDGSRVEAQCSAPRDGEPGSPLPP